MAEYWGLDTGDPLASGVVIGCMFDQPNITDQVLNFTSPITLSSVGSPTRPTVDGKLAYQPATGQGVTDTALTFNNQWLSALSRTQLAPLAYMFEFRTNIAPAYSDQFGLMQLGSEQGSSGVYDYLETNSDHTSGWTQWNRGNLANTITVGQLHRVIVTATDYFGSDEWGSKVSFDGVVQAQTNPRLSSSFANDDFGEIGRIFTGLYGYSFAGVITDFFMWDRELTDQEIDDLEADPHRFLIPPDTGPVATQNAILMGENF